MGVVPDQKTSKIGCRFNRGHIILLLTRSMKNYIIMKTNFVNNRNSHYNILSRLLKYCVASSESACRLSLCRHRVASLRDRVPSELGTFSGPAAGTGCKLSLPPTSMREHAPSHRHDRGVVGRCRLSAWLFWYTSVGLVVEVVVAAVVRVIERRASPRS